MRSSPGDTGRLVLASGVGLPQQWVGTLAQPRGLLSTRAGTDLGSHPHLPPLGCEALAKGLNPS